MTTWKNGDFLLVLRGQKLVELVVTNLKLTVLAGTAWHDLGRRFWTAQIRSGIHIYCVDLIS